MRRSTLIARALCLLLGLTLAGSGCRALSKSSQWRAPEPAAPDARWIEAGGVLRRTVAHAQNETGIAEAAYARAITEEQAGDAHCVDHYFLAAALIWPRYQARWSDGDVPAASARECQLYCSSVQGLISNAQRLRRLDERQALIIHTPSGMVQVPLVFHGVPFSPEEIGQFAPVGPYQAEELIHTFRNEGLGVPFVGMYRDAGKQPGPSYWFPDKLPIALTAVLRADVAAVRRAFMLSAAASTEPNGLAGPENVPGDSLATLEWYDPLHHDTLVDAPSDVPLARDLSAPYGYVFGNKPREWLASFLAPGEVSADDGLRFLEPWQLGKKPIIFVHGLLSDPVTWLAMANELRADPAFREQYQLLGFRYSTGAPFIAAAKRLREELHTLHAIHGAEDPAAHDRWILVGHSMGGLISKLQVTSSGDRMFRAFSKKPIDQLRLTPLEYQQLSERFFFEPVPFVSTVVYIATPHRGSLWANRPAGRIASRLVNEPSETDRAFREIVERNPDAFDLPLLPRMPSSIDLLMPDNPILKAMEKLPVNPRVNQFGIIGEGQTTVARWTDGRDGDGVVPVSSARPPGATWEVRVRAKHDDILRQAKTVALLTEILEQEAARQ